MQQIILMLVEKVLLSGKHRRSLQYPPETYFCCLFSAAILMDSCHCNSALLLVSKRTLQTICPTLFVQLNMSS